MRVEGSEGCPCVVRPCRRTNGIVVFRALAVFTDCSSFGWPVSSIDVVVFKELQQGEANDKHDSRTDGHKQFSMVCNPAKKEHSHRDYGCSPYRSPN
jgi:hypothetical protein